VNRFPTIEPTLKNQGGVAGEAESDHHFVKAGDRPRIVSVVIKNPQALSKDSNLGWVARTVPISNNRDVAGLTVDVGTIASAVVGSAAAVVLYPESVPAAVGDG
jgi:hypothetical protein